MVEPAPRFGPHLHSQLFEAYDRVVSLQSRYNLDLEMPMFLVVGSQSAGKTTFLENLAGLPLGFSRAGVATRCPVKYSMQHDPDQLEPYATIEGREVGSINDLPARVQDHMDKLGNSFSEQILEVYIRAASCSDLVLIDTPGLRPNDGNGQSKVIESVVARYGRDRRFNIIFVSTFTFDKAVQNEVAVMDHLMTSQHNPGATRDIPPPRPDWKNNTFFVVNKFDKISTEVQSLEDLRQALATYMQPGPPHFLCSLRPQYPRDSPIQGGMNPTPAQLREHLPRVREYEQGWLTDYLGRLGCSRDEFERLGLANIVGLDRVIFNVQEWINRRLLHSLNYAVPKLTALLERLNAEISQGEDDLKVWDRDLLERSYAKLLTDYALDFSALIQTYCNGHRQRAVNVHQQYAKQELDHYGSSGNKVPPLLDSSGEYVNFNRLHGLDTYPILSEWARTAESRTIDCNSVPDNVLGSDLSQDMNHAKDLWRAWALYNSAGRAEPLPGLPSVVGSFEEKEEDSIDVTSILEGFEGSPALDTIINGWHIGYMSFKRLLTVFSYLLYSYDAQSIADKTVAVAKDPNTGTIHTAQVVLDVAEVMLQHAQTGMPALTLSLQKTFARYADFAHKELLYGPPGLSDAFTDPASGERHLQPGPKYAALRMPGKLEQVQQAVTTVYEDLLWHRLREVEKAWSMNLSAMAQGLEVDLPAKFLMGYVATPLENLIPAREDVMPRDIATEHAQLAAGKKVEAPRFTIDPPASQSKPAKKNRLPQPEYKREEQKRDVLRRFRALIQQSLQHRDGVCEFTMADAAMGGLMQPYLVDSLNPDVAYIKNAGREYYYFAIFQVMCTCEALFKYRFLSVVRNTTELSQLLQKQMFVLASKFADDAMLDGDIEAKMNLLNQKKLMRDELQEAIHKIRRCQSAFSQS